MRAAERVRTLYTPHDRCARPHAPMHACDPRTHAPVAQAWNRVSQHARDFVSALLCADPASRLTAQEALQHPWMLVHRDALPDYQLEEREAGSGAL